MTETTLLSSGSSMTVDHALKLAITHHQTGQLQDAEHLYRAILQALPKHPDANHNLGVLAVQLKQPALGLSHFQIALEVNPNQGQYWLSYIDALILTGHQDAARQVLAQGLQHGLRGDAVEALAARLMDGELAGELSDRKHQSAVREPLSAPALMQCGEKQAKPKHAKPVKSAKNGAVRNGEGPSRQELNKLVSLFNQGRHVEMETLLRTMTVRFPRYGIGWKLLGDVLIQMGRVTEALAPLQKSAVLLPGDADVHLNLGVSLQGHGCLADAEASFRKALELKPDFAEAYYNLGNILKDQGRLDEAEVSYRQALAIKSDYAEAHSNLGVTLDEQDRLDEAEASFQRALEIKPSLAEAYSNLGNTLNRMGDIARAIAAYEQAIHYEPNLAVAHCALGDAFRYMDRTAHELLAYQKALAIDPGNVGLIAALWMAIRYYLEGSFEQFQRMLLVSQPLMATTSAKYHPFRIYWQYLERLLPYFQQANENKSQSKVMEHLQVIGESHSLSAHGTVVNYRQHEMRCSAEWIAGCKQWHLGNSKANKYKYKFEAIMARLPRQSPILLLIGEIDCRPDEGIITAWKKSPDKSLEGVGQATASAYVAYVARVAAQYGHQIIVGGVPAPNRRLDILAVEDATQLVSLIRAFNVVLKNQALLAGMDFLDLHALTDRGDGIAGGQWHIDFNHLYPAAMAEAFGRYCLYA